jgi:hypothetical protein
MHNRADVHSMTLSQLKKELAWAEDRWRRADLAGKRGSDGVFRTMPRQQTKLHKARTYRAEVETVYLHRKLSEAPSASVTRPSKI